MDDLQRQTCGTLSVKKMGCVLHSDLENGKKKKTPTLEVNNISPPWRYVERQCHHYYLTFLEMSRCGRIKQRTATITIQVARLGVFE